MSSDKGKFLRVLGFVCSMAIAAFPAIIDLTVFGMFCWCILSSIRDVADER